MKKSVLGNKGEWKGSKYILIYSLFFIVAALYIVFLFKHAGKSFVSSDDGFKQHYKALIYYSRFLRRVLRTIFIERSLHIPTWDFTIGEGSDILQALQYYVIGDPFNAPSVLVPTKYIYLYYHVAILLRMWFSGIAFIFLCIKTGKKNPGAVLAGACSYAFCFWSLYTLARHPFFLNPMVYFPLIVLGVEKVLAKKRPYLLTAAVALAAFSNFYFFYNIVLLTILYTLLRIIYLYHKEPLFALKQVFRVALYSVLGTGIAAVLFLPVCYFFLHDSRMYVEYTPQLFYSLSYYKMLPVMFLSSIRRSWLCLGFTAPVLISIFLLWTSRGQKFLKLLSVVVLIMILSPLAGQILNGLSYVSNRWCWAAALLVCYILTAKWESLCRIGKKHALGILAISLSWLALCYATNGLGSFRFRFGVELLVLTAVLLLVFACSGRIAVLFNTVLLLSVTCVELFGNMTFAYTSYGGDLPEQTVSVSRLKKDLKSADIKAVTMARKLENIEDNYFRYSGVPQSNTNLIGGFSSSRYYWSISNPYINTFRRELEMRENKVYNYIGYDDRTDLETLSAVKYHVTKEDNSAVPYGFTEIQDSDIHEITGYHVYVNDYALPLVYAYDTYITEDTWNELNPAQREEAMRQSLLLEDYQDDAGEGTIFLESQVQSVQVMDGEDIRFKDGVFDVREDKAEIELGFEGLPGCELYLQFEGLEVDKESVKQLTSLKITGPTGVEKKLEYWQDNFRLYNGRHDFCVNLGYFEEATDRLTMEFEYKGRYTVEDIKLLCLPMERYPEHINEIKNNLKITDLSVDGDEIRASVESDGEKYLCAAFPFSEGWTAYVDGEKVPVYAANRMYIGLKIEEGKHELLLKYHTPLLKTASVISVISFLLFIGMIVWRETHSED